MLSKKKEQHTDSSKIEDVSHRINGNEKNLANSSFFHSVLFKVVLHYCSSWFYFVLIFCSFSITVLFFCFSMNSFYCSILDFSYFSVTLVYFFFVCYTSTFKFFLHLYNLCTIGGYTRSCFFIYLRYLM